MMIEIKQLPLGPLQTNCYLIVKNNDCLVVDPGSESERLLSFLKDNNLNPIAILLTHAHYDHIGAVDAVRDQYKIDVYIHKNEADWLGNPTFNGAERHELPGIVEEADHFFAEDKQYEIGKFKFQMLETPGHSPGGVSFYFEDEKFVITGDALFRASIGRTDFLGGNHSQLIDSVKNKLLVLADDVAVLPGHGPTSTIGYEKQNNPFVR